MVLPEPPFSAAFRSARQKNTELCRQFGDGICGWAADGDPYLDSQEYESDLTVIASHIHFKTLTAGVIEVKLNVYPSVKDAEGAYNRSIVYKMVNEQGAWVVDDIVYSGQSSIAMMEEEDKRLIGGDGKTVEAQSQSAEH